MADTIKASVPLVFSGTLINLLCIDKRLNKTGTWRSNFPWGVDFWNRLQYLILYLHHSQTYLHQIWVRQHQGHTRRENRPCLEPFLSFCTPSDNDHPWKCNMIEWNASYGPCFQTILLFFWLCLELPGRVENSFLPFCQLAGFFTRMSSLTFLWYIYCKFVNNAGIPSSQTIV